MKAIILAAGKGTRMQSLTAEKPKPMLELCGKPMLEHILVCLRESGITEFALITGYCAEVVETYFGNGSRLGIRIHYFRQSVQNGTGAAFHLAKEFVGEHSFFAGFGDIIVSVPNYNQLLEDFLRRPAEALVSLNWVEDPYQGAAVFLDKEDNITQIVEKPPKGSSSSHWNSAGLFVFSPVLFDYTKALVPSARGEYEITDAIQAMVRNGLRVRGYKIDGFWSDVGKPEDIEPASKAIAGQVELT
jgi:UDP-N-acetylglucosamine diphosphorylase / glucose-1-phosphate thymidylyltransferase / UDP-N-acetylgalactosamine diphosphorylase / glucosamine-1-phosphate N-acetyltransferase / galactosamine-1-phosphate N-acetyltransferase